MSDRVHRVVNLVLRLLALGAKFVLMLYMARFVSLPDLGEYGLVAGTVAILMTALGFRLDYVVVRELVGASPFDCARKMRDQLAFYALNYMVLGVVFAVLIASGAIPTAHRTLIFIFVLSALESCSAVMFTNLISRGHPVMANLVLLLRTGLWVFPVVALGLGDASYRSATTAFVAWIAGAAASIAFAFWTWRALPWRALRGVAVDRAWIWRSLRSSALIWVSTVALTTGTLVDRFVVGADLNLELVGVVTFYASFASALFALIESSVFCNYPRLVSLHRENDKSGFDREAARMLRTGALLGGAIGLAMAVIVPVFGKIMERPLIVDAAPTFWLLLFGTWIRISAQSLYLRLFARHLDRAIWLGDLLYIVPGLGANLVLVPMFGLIGIGYSAVVASAFILAWRAWHLRPAVAAGSWTRRMASLM